MVNNRKLILGVFLCIFLTLVMVKDLGLIKSDPDQFFISILLGSFVNYYIVAYLLSWDMINYGGGMLKKGEHDLPRRILFISCVFMWIFWFFR